MKPESKHRRELELLELKRKLYNDKLDERRRLLNERMDRREAKLNGSLNQKQEKIIYTALRLLDNEGLNNLSLRKLATALNMQAPAIYWHFKNKETLIDYMAEAILIEQFAGFKAKDNSEDWHDWLLKVLMKLRTAMLSRTDGARVVAGAHIYPTATLGRIMDISIQSLTDDGIEILEAGNIVMTALHYTFGHVIEEQSSPSNEDFRKMDLSIYPTITNFIKATQKAKLSNLETFKAGIKLIIA